MWWSRVNAPVIGHEPITGHSFVFYCLQQMKTIEYNGVAGYWFMADYWCIYPIKLIVNVFFDNMHCLCQYQFCQVFQIFTVDFDFFEKLEHTFIYTATTSKPQTIYYPIS